MTVRELIEALQELDPDAAVFVYDLATDDSWQVQSVAPGEPPDVEAYVEIATGLTVEEADLDGTTPKH